MLQEFDGDLESVTELLLVDGHGHLRAILPLSRLALAPHDRPLAEIEHAHLSTTRLETSARKVAEQFDKYNLRSLPVLDDHQQLSGVIRPEHVIAWLRSAK
jgi:Mg/Co/Ni transporter MgtE